MHHTATLPKPGDRLTGRCVTTYAEHTGEVVAVDVAATYSDGTPREHRVTIRSDATGRTVILAAGTERPVTDADPQAEPDLLEDLRKAGNYHADHYPPGSFLDPRGIFDCYMIGALVGRLERLPGGREAWAAALEQTVEYAEAARVRHAAKGWTKPGAVK